MKKIRRSNRSGACHSMPFSTTSPANWSARSVLLTGIYIMWISYPLFFSHQQASLFSYTNEWVLRGTFRVCRAFKELMLSVTIRYLPRRWALIWIKATKIADISEVNNPLGSPRRKPHSRSPEWYTPKPVPAPPFEPSVKSQIPTSPICHQPRHHHLVKVP
jgi:hypothetical protein